ncbi:MAG: sigma-70 family RNA polymerase sigma factor [Deltaproteobacteria bacterium]|nr:sigma-70 family RNA polymerase sigma factor [Deltaproteobacteria bacterium]
MDTPEILQRFHSELSLVDIVAGQVRKEIGGPLDDDELRSFGREGLLAAARRFDPDRGVSFKRYAGYRVRGAILDGMRSTGQHSRRVYEKVRALQAALLVSEGMYEDTSAAVAAGLRGSAADDRFADYLSTIATAMAVGFGPPHTAAEDGAIVPVDASQDPEKSAENAELMALVRTHLDTLPEGEATLIRRHFLKGEDIDEVAREMGLSKSWGSRMLARGIATLTKKMQAAAR